MDEPCFWCVKESDCDGAQGEEYHPGDTADDAVGFDNGLEIGGLGVCAVEEG